MAAAAQRVLDTRVDGSRLGRDETRSFAVGGIGSVPATGVEAVLVSLTAEHATAWSSLTIWPAGAPRPAPVNLDIQPGRSRIAVVVPLGSDGKLSIWNDRGQVDVIVDVLGWFAQATEYRAVTPLRILDTNPGAKAKPAPLGPGATVAVQAIGRAGIPADARAVVVEVASRTTTATSGITVWPAGEARPELASLVAQPTARLANLVVVEPGDDGAISVHNGAGWTHLTVDVVGWLPAASSYRPVAPAALASATQLPPGGSLDVQVTGVAGIPSGTGEAETEQAYAVALNITATPAAAVATTVTAWPAGDKVPDAVAVATPSTTSATVSFSILRVGNDGKVSLQNGAAAASVQVDVVGWFAVPAAAAQLEVPETTKVPVPEDVTPVEVVTQPGPEPGDPEQITQATVELAAGAPPAEVGNHVVLGPGGVVGQAGMAAPLALEESEVTIDEAFPEGFLGEVVATETDPVTGVQTVTMVPAMLEDVFPEGDIAVNLDADTDYVGQVLDGPAAQVPSVMLASVTPPTKGVKVDFEYVGDGKKGKDPATSAECSMDGIEAAFGPLLDMQFSVRWRWLKAPVVTALATLGAEARLALENVSVRCGVDIRLWKATVTFTAGPVPVVVVFEVGAALDIAAGLAGLNLSATANAYITIGVKDNRGYADAGYDFDATSFDELAAQVSNLAVYGQADVWLKFGVKLYSVIGPRISVGPFIEAAVTTAATQPWWRIDFGLAGKIALSLDLWFHEWNWDLYESEIPLADLLVLAGAMHDCPAMPYTGHEPCRSAKPATRADGSSGRRVLYSRIRLASAREPMRFLSITPPATVADARVGDPYSLRLSASGVFDNASQVTWTAPGGIVGVPGLVLVQDGADAVVGGTPTTDGTFTATVEIRQAWDSPTGPARSTWQVPITVVASGGNMRPVCEGGATTATQGGGFATMVDCADPDGDPLTYAIATLPAHGTLEMISADTFEYTAPTDYLGPDPWTFTASDGALTSEPATFMVTVAEAGGCTSYGTDGDDYVEVVADGEWYCGGAGNDTVGLVALGAVFDGGDGDDWVVRNEAQVFGQEGADGIRDNLGSFLGATGADYVVWNEGYFSGDDDADWVTDNFGSVEGGPGDDHVDTNWPEGEFLGGEGIDTVDDNQGIFDPGPQ